MYMYIVLTVHSSQDNTQFIGDKKTGYEVPGDVEFEEYQGKIKKKEKKEDKRKVTIVQQSSITYNSRDIVAKMSVSLCWRAHHINLTL